MQKPNPRFDPQDRRNTPNQGGVGVPVKGDSSGSNAPIDPDSATVFDFGTSSSDSQATFVDPDATVVEGMPPLPPLSRRPASRVQNTTPMLTW